MATTTYRRLAIGIMLAALVNGAQPEVHAEHVQSGRAERARGGDRDRDDRGSVRRVRGRQTDSVRVWLPVGRHEVRVRGTGRTDLDLYVRDQHGRTLVVDERRTDDCRGSFLLRRAGYIEIRVRNLGRVHNDYELTVR